MQLVKQIMFLFINTIFKNFILELILDGGNLVPFV